MKSSSETNPYASLCKYYHGEEKCPDKWKDDIKGRFWYGETLFCKWRPYDDMKWIFEY